MDTKYFCAHPKPVTVLRAEKRRHDSGDAHGDTFRASSDVFEEFGRLRACLPGETIFQQGGDCNGLFRVKSGLIGLRRLDEKGDAALVCLSRHGSLLGNRAFLARDVHCATAEVLTPSLVHFIEASQLQAAFKREPALREMLVQEALAELTQSEAKCATLLTEDLKSRFIKLLTMLHADYGVSGTGCSLIVDVPIQRKVIAALIGAAPESLSRLLKSLVTQKLIHIDGQRIDFTVAARGLPGLTAFSSETRLSPQADALSTLMEARQALLAMLEAPDSATREALNSQVQTASRHLDDLLNQLTGSEARRVAVFNIVWKSFKKTRQNEILPAIFSGHVDAARKIALGIQAERFAQMKDILSRTPRATRFTQHENCLATA